MYTAFHVKCTRGTLSTAVMLDIFDIQTSEETSHQALKFPNWLAKESLSANGLSFKLAEELIQIASIFYFHVTMPLHELYLHITKILLLFLLSYIFCRVDSWCKLVFNYGKPTVNMFYDYDYAIILLSKWFPN